MSSSPEIKLDETLEQLLNKKSITQAELAEAVGISPSAITQYINGNSTPKLKILIQISDYLDVSLDYLVKGTSRETEVKDYGPIVDYMDESLQNVQLRTAKHSSMVAHIGQRLSSQLDETVKTFIQEENTPPPYGGIITDQETLALESHSSETWLINWTLHYTLLEHQDGPTPGRFFTTIRDNLNKGRTYRYLLPQSANQNWDNIVSKLREQLSDENVSDTAVYDQLKARTTDVPIFTGCGLYQLDLRELEDEHPVLYEYLQDFEYINQINSIPSRSGSNEWVGYVIPPNKDVQGDTIMDRERLMNAVNNYKQIWANAEKI